MSVDRQEGLAPKKLGLARRLLGGYLLDRLSPREKSPVQIAVDRENEMIDQRHRAFFHANLFRTVKPTTPENIVAQQKLREEFERSLATCTSMADRFGLFADAAYVKHVHTLDLGETKLPGSHDEVSKLKDEYHELLDMLIDAGAIESELSRKEAKPSIHFRFDTGSEYAIATRNRDLFSFEDGERTLSAAKRMTFLMPKSALSHLKISEHGALYRRDVRKVEALLDAQDPATIIPVRTVYYAKSKPLDK